MKLSMMSYTLARQSGFSLPKMFELTRALDLAGVDMVTCYNTPATELRKMADDYGVPIIAHTFFAVPLASPDPAVRRQGVDIVKQGLDDAAALGAPVVMIPTPPAEDGADRHTQRQRYIDGFRAVMPLAKQAGIILTVENFPGQNSPFVTAADFRQAFGQLPDLRLTFDNGNVATAEAPGASFTANAAQTVHAHFKDWLVADAPAEGYRQMLDGRYYKPALIGEGCVDHRGSLQAMKAAGYTGCINIEYESSDYPAIEAVRRAADTLRSLMAELN